MRASALVLLLAGCALNVLAYGSIQPLLAAGLVFFVGVVVLRFTNRGTAYARRMFHSVFAAGLVVAGVAALYANYLNDVHQTASDPAWFFQLASGRGGVRSLEALANISEGAGAIILWGWVYDAFAAVGFAKEPYIGIFVNVIAVAFAGVLAVSIARRVYGDDQARMHRLVALFSWCGLLWLFAAIHLRDSVVLLVVTTLVYAWVRYLHEPGFTNLLVLVALTAVDTVLIAVLRTDFLFVPLAMASAGIFVSLLYEKRPGTRKLITYAVAFAGMAIAGGLYVQYYDRISSSLTGGYKLYLEMARHEASGGSLGMSLIVNQPIPIRLVLGSAYLYVYPIPFWSGLRGTSAYALFKSVNALFFYALVPLLAVAVTQIVKNKSARRPAVMFLFVLGVGFTLAIAGTSGETRHLGAFLVPLFVLALLPDLTVVETRRTYRNVRFVFLGLVAAVHLAWFALKL